MLVKVILMGVVLQRVFIWSLDRHVESLMRLCTVKLNKH